MGNAGLKPEKEKVFWLITISLPFLVLVLLEFGLRIFNYGVNVKLFIPLPDETSKFYGINLEVSKRYFTKLGDVPTPRKDLFLKEKPKNGYRIFVLGESSAAGFPYGNNITFSRILNRRLSDTFPDKYIEIVNTAMTAINTYTQLDFLDEILEHKPDAILIYTGHNEFYGALGVGSMESLGKNRWLVKAALTLQKLKIYELVRDIINRTGNLFSNAAIDDKSDPSATLMERIVQNKIIPYGSKDYELGKVQFRENLREIIQTAQSSGVKVLISELVSNVRDNEPFESVETSNYPSAQKIYSTALDYEKRNEYEESQKNYYLAKDLDALRFRAPEEFNEIIHEVAADFNIPVVPMKCYFESHSPHGLIGNNLMCEHLHPNIDGYFLMADAFYNTLKKEKFINNEWQKENIISSSHYRYNWGYTTLDSIGASLAIKQLKGGWPFQKENGTNIALSLFKPSTKVDTIAFSILKGEKTLEQGHIELADYYESQGELEQAFKEYKALIYTVPYFDLFYEPAVKVLLSANRNLEAVELLQDLLKYQESSFAYRWIGQIQLISNNTAEGILYLEKARAMEPQNVTLLYNLGRAYFKISRFEKGNGILSQLKYLKADFSMISNLEEYGRTSYNNFKTASGYIKKAQDFIGIKNYRNALVLLKQSLQVQETSLAYELIGTINLKAGSKTDALTYLEKASELSDARDPKLLYNLSDAYYVNADYGKAKLTYEQLKKIYPDYPDTGNLNARLNQVGKPVIN